MPTACNYSWPDDLDALIRAEARAARVPLSLAYTFIAVESGFNPRARNLNPPIEDSVGLLQLNRLGGQGTGYSVAQLMDPTFNLRVGFVAIAAAYAEVALAPTLSAEMVYRVAIGSGHPGRIPRNDPRIQRILEAFICFSAGADLGEAWEAPLLGPFTTPALGLAASAAILFGPAAAGAAPGALLGTAAVVRMMIMAASYGAVGRQLIWRLGPRTITRRQLRALSPAGLQRRVVYAIDPRAQAERAFRLPRGLAWIRLPFGHRLPRW